MPPFRVRTAKKAARAEHRPMWAPLSAQSKRARARAPVRSDPSPLARNTSGQRVAGRPQSSLSVLVLVASRADGGLSVGLAANGHAPERTQGLGELVAPVRSP